MYNATCTVSPYACFGLSSSLPNTTISSRFDVVYTVRFEATWSDSTHPNAYPANAHFSPLVALSHTPNFYVFFSGYPASDGLRILAETGQTDSIMDEFSYSINTGQALDARVGPDVDSPGQGELSIGVTATRHAVTVLSMIAQVPIGLSPGGPCFLMRRMVNGMTRLLSMPLVLTEEVTQELTLLRRICRWIPYRQFIHYVRSFDSTWG